MDAEGCILGGQMLSGNTSDITWNSTWVDPLDQDFPQDFWKDKCYIADSALFSAETIQRIRTAEMSWLGRFPARFALCGELKTRAWEHNRETWKQLRSGAAPSGTASVYHVQPFDVIFLEKPARAFVFHSSALDKKKEHRLQRDIARYDALNKKLAGQTFATAEAADREATQLLESMATVWHTAKPVVEEQTILVRRRGRPKAGTSPDPKQVYTVTLCVTNPDAEVVQAERQRRATWILLTSRMTLDAQTALDDYKGQHHNEHGFRWTKPPIHLGAFWLEKPERVAGLGYLLLLALQFARFMRAVVRDAFARPTTARASLSPGHAALRHRHLSSTPGFRYAIPIGWRPMLVSMGRCPPLPAPHPRGPGYPD